MAFASGFSIGYLTVALVPFLLFFLFIPIGLPWWSGRRKEGPVRKWLLPALFGVGSGAVAAFIFRFLV